MVSRRMTLSLGTAAVVGFALPSAAQEASAARDSPTVVCRRAGHCEVSSLPMILGDRDVEPHLRSGLSASLILTFEARRADGRVSTSSAKVGVRFEPWDEVFHLVVQEPGSSAVKTMTAPSWAALIDWWGGIKVVFPWQHPPPKRARLDITVVPFSEGEEGDTRRWYAEALRAESETNPKSVVDRLGRAFDKFTISSIKRRGVKSFVWSRPVRVEE